jgi:hypothetical protein
MNMVQTMYSHACKCKNDTCFRIRGRGMRERSGGGCNSRMIHLIHGKNLYKCFNVPTPSTTTTTKK